MIVRARLRWTLASLWVLVGILTVIWHGPLVLALALLLPLGWTLWRRMRLTADHDGVTVVNFFRTYRIPWTETSAFDWTFERVTISINVLLRDDSRRHFWYASPERSYRSWRRNPTNPTAIVRRLGLLRAQALGEPAPPADIDEIDLALRAVTDGDRGPIDRLVEAKRLDRDIADALTQRSQQDE